MTRRWESYFWPLFTLAIFLGLWHFSVIWSKTSVFPAPLDVVTGLQELIRNGLLLAGVDPWWQGTFVGSFIILAVVLERLRGRRS